MAAAAASHAAAAGRTDVIALLAFHGSAFNGWQSQARGAGRFVQAVSEEGLARALPGAPRASLLATSRTDAGVHARQLLVRTSVPTPALQGRAPGELAQAWNAQLPEDVRVARLRYALPSQIQVKFASLGKAYSFYVRSGGYQAGLPLGNYTMYVAGLHRPEALQRLSNALALFRGAQDFGAFSMGRKGGGGSAGAPAGTPGGSVRLISCADVTLLTPSQVQWELAHAAPGEGLGQRIAPAEGALEAEEAAAAAAAAATAAAAAAAADASAAAAPAAAAPAAAPALAGSKRAREKEGGAGGGGGAGAGALAGAREGASGQDVHLIRMRFVGDGFLRHQIRLMVGAALDVVRGGTSLRDIAGALARGQPGASGRAQRHFTAASGRGLWLEEVLTHDDFWSAADYCNNRDPAFLRDHGLPEAHWHPARLKRGGVAAPGWEDRGSGSGSGSGAGAEEGQGGGGEEEEEDDDE